MAKILLVENDPQVRGLLKDYFSRFSTPTHEVTCFSSGEDALKALGTSNHFGVAIIANRLPGIWGFKLIPKIKERLPALPIIFISGAWNGPPPPGADAFYPKPFDVEEIGRAIRKLTEA